MKLPPIWRGRLKSAPVRSRIAQFRAVLRAAQTVEAYRERLRDAGLDSVACVNKRINEARDIEHALAPLVPIPLSTYQSLFTQRKPARRNTPHRTETRSALLLPYCDARNAVRRCHEDPTGSVDLYSHAGIASATNDLYNLSKALNATSLLKWTDSAVVVFCGIDAGLMSADQREEFWERYQVPLFQQFLGTDGRVVAAECEVHAGLHIHEEAAVIERVEGQLLLTSLTDEQSPALRVESGIYGDIDIEACECGRVSPRIVQMRPMREPNAAAAVA